MLAYTIQRDRKLFKIKDNKYLCGAFEKFILLCQFTVVIFVRQYYFSFKYREHIK